MIKLVCLDMDGVLTTTKNFWMDLHDAYGTLEEGTALTTQYLHTDYAKLVEEVVGRLWKGKPAAPFTELVARVPYSPGISEFFAALDTLRLDGERVPRAILTGGPFELAERIRTEFGVDFIFANQLGIHDHKVTGVSQWPVGAGTHTKARLIEQLCDDLDILPTEVLYVGDSAKDVDAFKVVGISVAFNGAPDELKTVATHVVESGDLRDLIPLLSSLHS
jgi:phosphoserine phosphatase